MSAVEASSNAPPAAASSATTTTTTTTKDKDQPPPETKGWLYKWTNYIKGYQKRWFVLANGLVRKDEIQSNLCTKITLCTTN